MSARRPRVKAIANIGVKRKLKDENVEKCDVQLKPDEDTERNSKIIKTEILPAPSNVAKPTPAEEETKDIPITNDSEENNKSTTITESQQQVRPRQRIRATPCFDVRRNSVHGSTDDPPESLSQMKEPKLPPPSVQNLFNSNRSPIAHRTRTESVSSVTQQNNSSGASTSTSVSDHQQYVHSNCPPSREHIPPRHRKISTMEDAQRLSAARKEFNSKYSRKTPEKSVLKMFEFIYYNPSSNPMKFDEKCTGSTNKLNEFPSTKSENETDNLEKSDDNQQEPTTETNNELDSTNALPVPQLKLGPNGEIILDEKSLVIETTAEKQIRSNLAASKNFIYLDEYSGNNGFYSRQKRTRDWSPEETIKFYRCLHTVGTDFSLMLSLFPNRSRRDLKLKFKKEEKFNGNLINKAILYPKAFDIEELKREFEREEELVEEKRKQWNEIEESQKCNSVKTENKCTLSKGERILSKGDLAYKNENTKLPKQKRTRKKCESNNKKLKKTEQNDRKNEIKMEKDDNNDEIITNTTDDENLKSLTQHNDENDEVSATESTGVGGSVEITDIGEIFSFGDILPQLKGSSLALVSSIDDSQNVEKVTHEIYIVCKKTGNLSNKPLDLPKDTIDCILMAMGKIEDK